MGRDDELRLARQLTTLLVDRVRFAQLEEEYCTLRRRLSPTAALDRALAELLAGSEYEEIAAFISRGGGPAPGHGGPPAVQHSVIDALEDRCEERQSSERHERRERMGVDDLAADVAADTQLAAAYDEGRDEAAAWLEKFSGMVLGRASRSPTPTGRRFLVDQALKALVDAKTDYQARGGDDAVTQAAWCAALRERLIAGSTEEGQASSDPVFQGRDGEEPGDLVGAAPEALATTTTQPMILDVLRSAMSSLGDEDSFSALIEAANGHDDNYDPADPSTLEALDSLLEEEALEPRESAPAPMSRRVRDELWTHLVWGYRVGTYLLFCQRARASPARQSASYEASELISYVDQARRRQDVVDLINDAELGAALHYHALSSTLLAAFGADRTRARASVRQVEDLGFLTALGAEELTAGPMLELEEARAAAGARAS